MQFADEIKYLAPRLLIHTFEGARLHHSTELYLDRLGRCEPGSFSATEQLRCRALRWRTLRKGYKQWPAASDSLFQGDNAFSIPLMGLAPACAVDIPGNTGWNESDASTLNFVSRTIMCECQRDGQCALPLMRSNTKRTTWRVIEQARHQSALDTKLMRLVTGPSPVPCRQRGLNHQCYPPQSDQRGSLTHDA